MTDSTANLFNFLFGKNLKWVQNFQCHYSAFAGKIFFVPVSYTHLDVYKRQLYADGWQYDAGLVDTMGDLICDALSALGTCLAGFVALTIRQKKKDKKKEASKSIVSEVK